MAFKYSITTNGIYFLTTTVVDWVDVFTRKELAMVIVDALNYCRQHKGLQIYAWCLMPSHLHLIASSTHETANLSDIMRDFKKFTSKEMVRTIKEIPESRRDWLLNRFSYAGKYNPKIKDYKFWQDGLHAVELTGNAFTDQKLNYVHQNPVASGIVYRAEDYVLSSAGAYAGLYDCLIEVVLIQ